MGSFAVSNRGIWAAIEATYRTGESIVAGDAIEVENLNFSPLESAKIVQRAIIRNSLAPDVGQYGGSLFGFTFDVEVKGSGTAGTAPRFGRLLQACGYKETIVAVTSVTYEPESDIDSHDSLTIWLKEGGNLRKIVGCRGSFTGVAEAGGRCLLSFTFIGHISSEAEAAAPSSTFETTAPPIFKGATFQADAVTTPIGSLSFSSGNVVAAAPDPNQSDSFGVIRVTGRAVTGSFDPESQAIGDQDPIGDARAATEFAIATGVIGSTAGNRWQISLPRCQYQNVSPGDRDAIQIYDAAFAAFPTSSGDDDLAIALT